MNSLSSILLLALLLLAPSARAEALLKATLDSAYLVTGEQTRLTLYLQSDERPAAPPVAPASDTLTIQFQQDGMRVLQNRQRVYIYSYLLRSFEVGTHSVPAFSVQADGKLVQSIPLPVRVASPDELTWNTQSSLGRTFRYASAVFVPEASPYDGETFPAEVKIYLPENTGGASSGMVDLEYDGLVAWRFEPVPATSRVQLPTGTHTGIAFTSTASPIRSGEVAIGPGKARIVMRVQRSERGFTIVQDMPGDFELPQRSFKVRPLPPGAPEGFAGAVGRFVVQASADTDELEEGDPISVRLNVSGTGNLDSLPAPRLDAAESDWKIYEPSRLERQGERRDVTGTVSFSQIVRPLTRQDQIPAFELAYFDPQTATYATSRSQPIPFQATPTTHSAGTAAVLPTLATPVEDMQGILAVVDPLRNRTRSNGVSWWRYWQLLPALLAVALLLRIVQLRILPRFKVPERERQLRRSLAEVAAVGENEGRFLRAAGAFIERWIPDQDREGELADLLARRDTDCFRPDHAERRIPEAERQSILKVLRERALATTALLAFLLAFLASSPRASAAEEPDQAAFHTAENAYLEGNYRTALEIYTAVPPPHSADLLYNIGNCYYQLNEPGKAALYYHRALLEDPDHRESLQNLRFLERTQGSIAILRPPYQNFLATLPRRAYTTLAQFGSWLAGLSVLALFALSSGTLRILSSLGLGCGVLLASGGLLGRTLYPQDADFAPATQRAVMTQPERTPARTEASDAGPKAIEVPPGSLCRILAPRGSWTYVEFPNLTRAWMPSAHITPLIPTDSTTEERL